MIDVEQERSRKMSPGEKNVEKIRRRCAPGRWARNAEVVCR
jgi:hypothetical protein